MLDPQDRELLLDALRPDPGTVLDRAVGTSFTLDLEAMLLAPLAFALFDTDGAASDPTALLAAIQQHAAHIALYCDEAHIHAKPSEQKLFVLLEPSLLPVAAPQGGSFHPKLWVLRFRDTHGATHHRVLVLSRNLTFDTCWDLIARLDEEPGGALDGGDVAHVLRGLDQLRSSPITKSVAASVAGVRLSVPEPFDEARLHAIGLPGSNRADPIGDASGDRALIVSPFLGADRLRELERLGARRTLVSRAHELERVGGNAVSQWGTPMILREGAGAAETDENAPADSRSGLHAKLYVSDRADRATWFVGSANATTSALWRNVETVLELVGPRSKVGVGSLLSEAGKEVRFRTLLEDFPLSDPEPAEESAEDIERDRLEQIAKTLCAADLDVRVREEDSHYELDLVLTGESPDLAPGDQLRARPVTRSSWTDATLVAAQIATLDVARVSEVTSLIAFQITGEANLVPPREFVMAGRLVDEPADRIDRLLIDLIPDRRRFALLLYLLLAAGDPDASSGEHLPFLGGNSRDPTTLSAVFNVPLYESLVRASARDVERLRGIDRLVVRMTKTEEGRTRLPEGFAEMWESFQPLLKGGTR
jgi:hypothetical protein